MQIAYHIDWILSENLEYNYEYLLNIALIIEEYGIHNAVPFIKVNFVHVDL